MKTNLTKNRKAGGSSREMTDKIQVTLLDCDNLPLAKGMAVLPQHRREGFFWPNCPMPSSHQLKTARCFSLPDGERLDLNGLELCDENPPRYDFHVAHG